jgi:hypothetical protein
MISGRFSPQLCIVDPNKKPQRQNHEKANIKVDLF